MRMKTIVIGGLVAGSLMISAGQAMARDYWHWSNEEHEWSRRADLRSDYRDLREARRQLEYDRSRGANWRRLAEDRRRIRQIEADIGADRGR